MIDTERLVAWMDARGLPGAGKPVEQRFISGGSQNEIYEIRRGDLHGALRMPPPGAPEARDKGILREWRITQALEGTDVPHTPAIAMCVLERERNRLGHDIAPEAMELLARHAQDVRALRGSLTRLVAEARIRGRAVTVASVESHLGLGRRPSTAISRRGAAWPSSSSRASRCSRRSTGRRRASRTSAGPRASTSGRSTAGRPSSSGSRGASCPASTSRPPGCASTSRSTTSPASCTATTSSPT